MDIAIAGAGPGGLAAALYLHRSGHRVTLFERFVSPHPVGSGLMMQPTGLAVMHDLGLFRDIVALGAPIDRLAGHDAKSGRVVLDVRYASLKRGLQGLGVHRAALFSVLYEAVLKLPVSLVAGFTVTGMERREGKSFLVAGGRREGPFDLVVDTLGSMSPLKPLSVAPSTPKRLQFGAIWATTPWVDGFDARALMQRYDRARVMIGVLPIGRQVPNGPNLAAFFWSLKPDDFEGLKTEGMDAWKAVVAGYWPDTQPHLDALQSFEQMTLARYAHATMPRPVGDGVVFVGDSAHSTSPQLGQGANMALLDARALSLALSEEPDLDTALVRYARLRRWHVRLYQAMSAAFTPFYQSDSTVLPFMRDVVVSLIAKIPPAPQFLAAMVAGNLLSPVKALKLQPAPPIEEAV